MLIVQINEPTIGRSDACNHLSTEGNREKHGEMPYLEHPSNPRIFGLKCTSLRQF
jgi:hypothetical protein